MRRLDKVYSKLCRRDKRRHLEDRLAADDWDTKREILPNQKKKSKGAARPSMESEVFSGREKSAPSVPRPSQSFGYERDDRGRLVMQEAPEDIYTGVKDDKIGPAKYFEGGLEGTVLKKSSSAVGFGLSKTKRKVFDPVGNEQVGPGITNPDMVHCTSRFYCLLPLKNRLQFNFI